MAPIRVLIVDDAVVVRRVLTQLLEADPEIVVVGTAANGVQGLTKVQQLQPDLVVLDVEMPEMDGLATLEVLSTSHPRLPVLMFSSRTERGAAITLEALMRGAVDYITKPTLVGADPHLLDNLRAEITRKIKILGRGRRTDNVVAGTRKTPPATNAPSMDESRAASTIVDISPLRAVGKVSNSSLKNTAAPRTASEAPARLTSPSPAARLGSRIDLVVIGVSTGGPNALEQVFGCFDVDFPLPIVVVQHMPPVFTRLLAERLARFALPVREAQDGEVVTNGTVYIAPGDYHVELKWRGSSLTLFTHQGEMENSCRPAADVLFRSAALACGSRVLAVVMTGMGQDGLRGCELLRDVHATILAQDEATSVVWGMPGAVARAGLCDQVLALGELGTEITRRAWLGRRPTA